MSEAWIQQSKLAALAGRDNSSQVGTKKKNLHHLQYRGNKSEEICHYAAVSIPFPLLQRENYLV